MGMYLRDWLLWVQNAVVQYKCSRWCFSDINICTMEATYCSIFSALIVPQCVDVPLDMLMCASLRLLTGPLIPRV